MNNRLRFWIRRTVVRLLQINSPNRLRVFFWDAVQILNSKVFRSKTLERVRILGMERAVLYAEKMLAPYLEGDKYIISMVYICHSKEKTIFSYGM